uniref:Uncharacterized protein n=1 Tax=Anopheles funestus TaxID=62324 RepID=A0A182S050_ANOFN
MCFVVGLVRYCWEHFHFTSPSVRSYIGETLSHSEQRQSIRDFFFVSNEFHLKKKDFSKFLPSVIMKQNSTKPTTTATPSKAGNRPSMQHGQHHHQQTSVHPQQLQQPVAVTYHQQQHPYQAPSQQQPHHSHLQQQHQTGCIVLPSAAVHQQPQHTFLSQPSGQQVPLAPMYVGGTVMGQQTAQQAVPSGFSTSVQQPPVSYLQTVQHHQPAMSQVQQRPDYQPTVADFVAASAAPGGVSGAHQPYKQQPHRQQAQPMQSYQEAPTSSYPMHMQSSLHPEGPTTEAQRKLHDASRTTANAADTNRMQEPNVYEL